MVQFRCFLGNTGSPNQTIFEDGPAYLMSQFLRSLEAIETEQLQPVWMGLPCQQLLRTFPDPLRHLRADETAVIKEKLEQA
ncbi:MAG: hypothetical protein AAFY20_20220 [Cyanobacteria bacterium J06639_14]